MPENTVLVQCRFDLTDAEIAAAARKRAAVEAETDKLESAFDIEKEKHKKALARLDGEAATFADLIRKGYELRDAECTIEYDYEAGLVNTARVDTGEVVKTRPMTETEKGEGPPLPLGPSILLSDSDPDVQGPKDCVSCGHLRVYHEAQGGCIQPDCLCEHFTVPDTETEALAVTSEVPNDAPPDAGQGGAEGLENPTACLHCGHPEGVHANTRKRGCMRADCECKGYIHPDPLGVADMHAEPEKREAEL